MGKTVHSFRHGKSSNVQRIKVDTRHGEFWLDDNVTFVSGTMAKSLLRECYERLLLLDSENHDLLGRILIGLKEYDVVEDIDA